MQRTFCALQTLAGRKILSAPLVGPPEGADPCTFTTNTAGQDVVCFVDIRDVRSSAYHQTIFCRQKVLDLLQSMHFATKSDVAICYLQILVSFLKGGLPWSHALIPMPALLCE